MTGITTKGSFGKALWPGLKAAMDEFDNPTPEQLATRKERRIKQEFWEHQKQKQLQQHNGVEVRQVTGHGESEAMISCAEGLLYFKGIPREYL